MPKGIGYPGESKMEKARRKAANSLMGTSTKRKAKNNPHKRKRKGRP